MHGTQNVDAISVKTMELQSRIDIIKAHLGEQRVLKETVDANATLKECADANAYGWPEHKEVTDATSNAANNVVVPSDLQATFNAALKTGVDATPKDQSEGVVAATIVSNTNVDSSDEDQGPDEGSDGSEVGFNCSAPSKSEESLMDILQMDGDRKSTRLNSSH